MKKIFTFIAVLTLSVGLFAEEVDIKPFITYEQPDPAFDYPYYPSWSENTGKLRIFRDNGLQDLNLEAGVSKIVFYKTFGTTGQIQINDPNWSALTTVSDWDGGLTSLEYVLDETAIECIDGDIVDGWGETAFVLQGDGLEVIKIAIVTGTSPVPFDYLFVDTQSGLTFQITDFGDVNNVMVVSSKSGYPTYSGDIVIPSTVNYHDTIFTVTKIGSSAFYGCNGLISITIPNSVTTIGNRAFYGCEKLASITIPNSVTTIGAAAFYNCTDLTSVTIPNSVTVIGEWAFVDCNSLTSINVDIGNSHYCSIDGVLFNYAKDTLIQYPRGNSRTEYAIHNSVTTIGDYAFSGCSGLTSVTIGNSVTAIGESAFSGCYGLTSVTIGNSVTSIGNAAFEGCTGLTSVTIPSSVTTIGTGAFSGCTSLPVIDNLRYADTYLVGTVNDSLSSYNIKEGTKWIGSQAFYWCSSLTSINIPNSVTTIGGWAFDGCSDLTSITIPNSVTTIELWAFNSCSGLTSVTIGNSVTTIGDWAFCGCSALTSITIPNSVTTIRGGAFNSCRSLSSVSIPNSVTTIGVEAFAWCDALTSIIVHWTDINELPMVGINIFMGIANLEGPSAATLHVPEGTKSIYENADQWKDFGTIVSDTPTPLPNALMHNSQPTMHKYFHNGNLIIERNGVKYTPAGQKIR